MPAVDTVLLPLCVGLTLLGVIATGIAWRRGNKGRVVQGVGLALAPIALFFSGLLRLIWNGAVAVGTWASRVVFSPSVWFGLSLLGLCIVLWVVGSLVARRFPGKERQRSSGRRAGRNSPAAAPAGSAGAANRGKAVSGKGAGAGRTPAQPPVDDDLVEIEALLKSRGIN